MTCLQCFDSVGWASGEHLACKNWVIGCWCGYLCRARLRLFAYGPADATASPNPIISSSFKLRLVLPFWYRLTQVVPEKKPLNRCSSSCSCCCCSCSCYNLAALVMMWQMWLHGDHYWSMCTVSLCLHTCLTPSQWMASVVCSREQTPSTAHHCMCLDWPGDWKSIRSDLLLHFCWNCRFKHCWMFCKV